VVGIAAALRRAAAILGLGLLVAAFGVTTVGIDGSSMTPTLRDGERAWVPRYETWWQRLDQKSWRPGDVVYFRVPGAQPRSWLERLSGGPYVIKRIVAVEGQAVELRRGRLWIDGAPVTEPYLEGSPVTVTSRAVEVVPPGHVFVLGDNRAPLASRDSRAFGPVPADRVAGRAAWVVWPWWRAEGDGGWRWNVRRL
jgi:signal peptidase I